MYSSVSSLCYKALPVQVLVCFTFVLQCLTGSSARLFYLCVTSFTGSSASLFHLCVTSFTGSSASLFRLCVTSFTGSSASLFHLCVTSFTGSSASLFHLCVTDPYRFKCISPLTGRYFTLRKKEHGQNQRHNHHLLFCEVRING